MNKQDVIILMLVINAVVLFIYSDWAQETKCKKYGGTHLDGVCWVKNVPERGSE